MKKKGTTRQPRPSIRRWHIEAFFVLAGILFSEFRLLGSVLNSNQRGAGSSDTLCAQKKTPGKVWTGPEFAEEYSKTRNGVAKCSHKLFRGVENVNRKE